MATSVVIVEEQLEGLRMGFGGTLLRADDEGYEDARRVHNGLIDRRPALIARCHGTADVADASVSPVRPGSTSACAAAGTTSPGGRSSTTR